MSDRETIDVYDDRISAYVEMSQAQEDNPALHQFMASVKTGGTILDLGCGPGVEAAIIHAAGFQIDPVDASAAMVAHINESYPFKARQLLFNQLDASEDYDGVWANFSLLHATRDEFPDLVAAIHKALRPDGKFHLGLKTGTGTSRDELGRRYAYYSEQELRDHLTANSFDVLQVEHGRGHGLAGTISDWMTVLARKS